MSVPDFNSALAAFGMTDPSRVEPVEFVAVERFNPDAASPQLMRMIAFLVSQSTPIEKIAEAAGLAIHEVESIMDSDGFNTAIVSFLKERNGQAAQDMLLTLFVKAVTGLSALLDSPNEKIKLGAVKLAITNEALPFNKKGITDTDKLRIIEEFFAGKNLKIS